MIVARRLRRALPPLAGAAIVFAFAACTSPESTRTRAGGAGGDVGNRRDVVQMHEGSRPFYQTPSRIGAVGMTEIDEAAQADRLSRGETFAASPPRTEAPRSRPQ